MRLRQVALVARDLDPVIADLCAVLGIQVAFHDPAVRIFGLRNAVLPVGDTFLEVVSPIEEGTTAGRFLARRGGDGGYMVLLQTDDLAADRRRVDALGVRVVFEIALDDVASIHLHPRDVGGAIVSFDAPRLRASWPFAGQDWERAVRTDVSRALVGVELQAAAPAALAARWAAVIGSAARGVEGEGQEIPLADGGAIRFLPSRDGRGDGIVAIDVRMTDCDRAVTAARDRGLAASRDGVTIGGTRIRFR